MHIVLFTFCLVTTILTFAIVELALQGPSRTLFLFALQASVALQVGYAALVAQEAWKERARRLRGKAGPPALPTPSA